jgi:hypothetical protein
MKSSADSTLIDVPKPQARSRVSNGSVVLPGVDGRSTWVRRLRDLMGLHLSDLGGDDAVSEAERSIVRRVATLTVELDAWKPVSLLPVKRSRVNWTSTSAQPTAFAACSNRSACNAGRRT